MATLLSIRDLSYRIAGRQLFSSLTFGIEDGDRIGLIGPNGTGKSTLLKIMTGEEKPAGGELSMRRGTRVLRVAQDDTFPDGATIESVLTAAAKAAGVDDVVTEVAIAMAMCGFTAGGEVVATLSGGWKKRLALAAARIQQPDVMLLDEPTNHLDLEAVQWLEDWLASASFASITITHDRYFLENTASRIIELGPVYADGCLQVDGAYSDFLEARANYMAALDKQQHAMAGDSRRELAWLRRGARARTTKAKGRIQDVHELMADLAAIEQRIAAKNTVKQTAFAASQRSTKELIRAEGLSKALGGKQLFSDLDLVASPGDRIGVVGANGVGKTTLIRVLVGDLEADAGELVRAEKLRVVWFDQSRAQLDMQGTVRDVLCPNGDTVHHDGHSWHVTAWAKRFGFSENQIGSLVGVLSGGEQARLLLAKLSSVVADVLIVDEPTNDLDLASLEVLEGALSTFPGCVILVTHDRYFMDAVSNRVLHFDAGSVTEYADFVQFMERFTERQGSVTKQETKPADKPTTQRNTLTASERRELTNIEAAIAAAEAEVGRLEALMASDAVATDAAKLAEIWDKQLPLAKAKVDEVYARWEFLEEKKASG
ncbi:MAG: ABC-F family ATP-binding cassette domain-containing protein [Armatimonadota bacterium]